MDLLVVAAFSESGVLHGLPGKLGELLEQEYPLLSSFRKDVVFLQSELSSIRAKVHHCESLDKPHVQTREWVRRARELAYDIDDWVDLFALRFHAGDGGSAIRQRLAKVPIRSIITNELQELKERVVQLSERWERYTICSEPEAVVVRRRLTTTLLVGTSNLLVGLDGPIEEVAKMIMDAGDRPELKVVSIVGMAGSGKSTLAAAVYKRLRDERNCFHCRAFVSLGRKAGMVSISKSLLSQLGGRHIGSQEIGQLIKSILEEKRYLIVLDDLWSANLWEHIKCYFPENNLGSRIIITTRHDELAKSFSGLSVYNIAPLSEVDSEILFMSILFGSEHRCPQNLKDISEQIMKKCGGLPLAIASMAAILAHKPATKYEWKRLGSKLLSCSHPDWKMQILGQIFVLSYNDLSPYLRTCLLYLSIFPLNYEVEVEHIVRQWIAEGFISGANGLSKEETARSYIYELFNTKMVQPLPQDHDDIPRYCRVQTSVHDFIVRISMDENFVTVVDDSYPIRPETIRWLSLQSNSNGDHQDLEQNQYTDLSHARSITVFGQASATPHLTDDLKMVRILDLQACDGPVCLDGLNKLLLLTHLNLRGTDVSELPSTIGKLRCLQTLDIRSTKVKELPPSIVALLRLRYLNIRDTDVSELSARIGELRCLETLDARSTKVKDLPPSIVKLKRTLEALLVSGKGMVNLVETATRMPEDFQHCHRIQKLGIIDLREHKESFVKALGGLNSLKVLKITWSSQQSTERAYREALVSSVKKWSQLESLTIHCELGCSMEFLVSLPSPPQKFKKFKVTAGRFVDVPQWVNGLAFLSFLQITLCKLCSGDLSILRNLPKLNWLILGLEFIPREAIVIENDGFSELTRFSVDCPVPWLTFRTGAMLKLTNLELKFCSGPASQESVPSGIVNLRSLTKIVLCYNQKWCADSSSVKMTVKAVKEDVAKHCKTVKLVINDTVVNVQEVEEATEAYNEAEHGGEVKHDVQIVGEGTSKTTSEIEEIEDDSKRGS